MDTIYERMKPLIQTYVVYSYTEGSTCRVLNMIQSSVCTPKSGLIPYHIDNPITKEGIAIAYIRHGYLYDTYDLVLEINKDGVVAISTCTYYNPKYIPKIGILGRFIEWIARWVEPTLQANLRYSIDEGYISSTLEDKKTSDIFFECMGRHIREYLDNIYW